MRLIRRSERGQVLPLFALMLVALMGITALAFDVSNAYAARRAFRTASDAAALAGALDLQVVGTRQVGAAQYTSARGHAQQALEKQLNSTATCTLTGNRSDCTFSGLPYVASIVTPLPSGASCVSCDPVRSVQVSVGNPSFTLTFARALGLGQFNVAVTAVAGLEFAHAYTLFALRPPSSPAIPGVRSLAINGGTHVTVVNGDVGTNANMTYSGTNSLLILDSGFRMDYFDPFNAPLWGTNPTPSKIVNLVPDPAYPIPSRTGAPISGPDTATNCTPIAATIYANPNYAPSVPVTGTPAAPDMSNITCYKPGIYGSTLNVNNGQLAILEPGLYFFDRGLDSQGSVIGGYTPASPGVALVFPESSGTEFKNRTGGGGSLTQIVALNAGTRYLNAGGQEATAALDYSNNPVQTNTTPARLMTVIVPPDTRCPVVFPFPASCSNAAENQNKSIDLSGGTGLYLAGVQYMPSDNVTVAGNAVTGGYIGQVWSWTLVYTGGSNINQEGAQSQGPGTIRLDAACTVPGIACVP